MSKRGGINNQNRRRETREDPPQKALSVQKAGEERIGAPVNGADRFQTLYEDAPFATVMIDREGRFQYLNSRFKQLFGCSPGDVPDGRTWFRKAFPDPEYRHTIVSTGAGIGIQGLPSEGGRRDRSPGSAGRTAAHALRNRDDSPCRRRDIGADLAASILRRKGYDVLEAPDGQCFLAVSRTFRGHNSSSCHGRGHMPQMGAGSWPAG